MDWHDDGLIIGGKRHGESSLILEVMTRRHGRHLGLVRGGRSRRMQPLLQPGNAVSVAWRARLEEHLGAYAVETTALRAAALMTRPDSLHGLNLVAGLLRLLAEREPHEALYAATVALVANLDDPDAAPRALVAFELAVLADCGFGLDLSACAATGRRDDLAFVSPRTGRAVSRIAGEPYRDRLLPLPPFLVGAHSDNASRVGLGELCEGFRLAAYFLKRDLYAPRGLQLPDAHEAYVALLRRREDRR